VDCLIVVDREGEPRDKKAAAGSCASDNSAGEHRFGRREI